MHPDVPPVSAPLEVDRVEWVPASPASVHVHVYGRWVDRPVAEPPQLLVGTERRRLGFDALEPSPPGVLLAFAVPNELRGRLRIDIALLIGAHELVLPPAGPGPVHAEAAEAPEAEVIDRAVLAERRARRAELVEESLSRRAAEAEQTAGTLEAQLANLEERLAQAADERRELEAGLADAERRLRGAQQREYAEQQLRIEVQDELDRLRRGEEGAVADLRARLRDADRQAEDMAREVERARRTMAEALQLQARFAGADASLAAEREARRRAEDELAALRGFEPRIAELQQAAGLLRDRVAELELRAAAAEAELATARETIAVRSVELEHAWAELARARREADALREERTEPAPGAEDGRHPELEEQVAQALAAVRELRERDEALGARDAAIQRLVGEVLATASALRETFERESRELETELTSAVVDERRRMADELRAVTELRSELDRVTAVPERDEPPRPEAAESVIADLGTAAERLRRQVPPVEEAVATDERVALAPRPAPVAQEASEPWLARSLARLAVRDEEVASRLLVGLLPVQRLRISGEMRYDLTVAGHGSFRVALWEGGSRVAPLAQPGGRGDRDFHLAGTVTELAEFAGGGIAGRPKGLQAEGRRRRLRRLLKQLREPLTLLEIERSDAAVEPGLVLAALTAGIDRAWSEGHRFTVAWEVTGEGGGTWTVCVGDGPPCVIAGLPEGGASATVVLPLALFLPLLAGFAQPPGEAATATGDTAAVELLRGWFERVQGRA